ncbi:hypothetical protein L1987_55636 [Smallanthus sonchifolius]|uniref:Uncharacterized protein n=1 Tax=Smallanthus sonchifolius TaxID=185202 RepID=A0ACB9E9Y0_9ASTR|nr:hypothetical protein L1987_55636 [Smallanthus sonchifolius]
MTTSMVTDMNLGQNKQSVNGGGGGRRKPKGSEFSLKKNKQPRRGKGVAQLEHERVQEEWKKMIELPHPLTSFNFTPSGCTAVPNAAAAPNAAAVHFRPAPTPEMLVQGIRIYGANLYPPDHVMDVIGSSSVGFRFENSKELSSIPNYMKYASDGCGVCHKKKRINCGSNLCSVNPFRSYYRNNTAVEMTDAGKTRRSSGQVTEAHRNGGSSMTEYEFYPGRGVGAEEYKELMRIGSTTWCGSGTSVGGAIGLRGGEGSCVTAITGSEEGSVSSLDLSLKLSY